MRIIKPTYIWVRDKVPNGPEMIANVATMGRLCYLSDSTSDDAEFVRKRIKEGHLSILEHEKLSVIVICDRGITHETVRHRIASYSQESTRYCNYSRGKFGKEITYIDIEEGMRRDPKVSKLDARTQAEILCEWVRACEDAERHYMRMIELGCSPQMARSVLNNSTKTAIGMTMNMREWRHFFSLRYDPAAHPQMQEVAEMLLHAFKDTIPVIFDDIEYMEGKKA